MRKSLAHRAKKILVEALESRQLLNGGALDTSFAGDGVTSAPFDALSVKGNGMAVQADGKIVEAGTASDGNIALVRYNANGTLDTSFGSSGTGKISTHVLSAGEVNVGLTVAIQPDGKIVVAGQALQTVNGTNDYMIICRFNSNGTFDDTFDHDGIVNISGFGHTHVEARVNAITFQKDGKIILAGDEEEGILLNPNDNILLVRLNTNGSIDTGFGTQGFVDFDHDDNEAARAVAIDYNDTPATNPDYGKIIVVGHVSSNEETETDYYGSGSNNATYKAVIARFTANGQLDTSFNKTGYIDSKLGSTSASVDAQGVAIEGDGYIVVAGSQGKNLGSTDHDFLLARIMPSGGFDKTFGGTGIVVTNMGGDDRATSVVIGGFGQQIIAGGTSSGKFALAAYNIDGTLDQSFGTAGKVLTSTDHGPSNVQLALAPNHTIVAAGGTSFNTARYFDAGPDVAVTSLDPTAGPSTAKVIGKFHELVPNPASFIVSQGERLPVSNRIYFTIGGSALPPNEFNLKFKKNNYTLSGMTVEITPVTSKIGYVDIPAGQTVATVTFTPNIIPAGTTTATFTINPNVNYEISTPPSQTITLLGTNPAPASTTLNPTADMYVQDGASANTNFGTATQLDVKKSSTTGGNQQTYLMFNLSSLSTINSVKLTLFGALNSTAQASLVTQLFSVADTSWLETGMTWNKKRAVSASPLASATITGTTPKAYTFDVTSYVKAQLAKGIKVVSFALINSTASSSAILFNSREAGSNKPTLTIT